MIQLPENGDAWLLFIGNLAIVSMGALFIRIAFGHWWCRYGREALWCAGFFLVTASSVRFAATDLGLISLKTGAIANGFSALAYLTILAGILYVHREYHRQFGEHAL